MRDVQTQYLDLHPRHDLEREEWMRLADRMMEIHLAAQKDILDCREGMRKRLSAEAWREIFAGTVPADETGESQEER